MMGGIATMALILLLLIRQRPPLRAALIEELIDASAKKGIAIEIPDHLFSTNNDLVSAHLLLYESRPIPDLSSTIEHIEALLSCPYRLNPKTGHIRLPHIHHNISLQAPNNQHDPEARHFNPTIIPLPSYVASFTSARYLLMTRLVTPGLHQESLACLASFCLPDPHSSNYTTGAPARKSSRRSSVLPPDTHSCTISDPSTLGPQGGLHCISPSRRLNIPPTPSKRCTGEWSSFPDIPGFHDPRVMWSNLGEPLIVVNSASAYGCVGLWVVDLRMLLPELQAVMERRAPAGTDGGSGALTRRKEGKVEIQEVQFSQPVVRYRTLTELTRWEGRGEVEKNWILWFPGQDGEAWVSYELFGKWTRREESKSDKWNNTSRIEGTLQHRVPHKPPDLQQLFPPWPTRNLSSAVLPKESYKNQSGSGKISHDTSPLLLLKNTSSTTTPAHRVQPNVPANKTTTTTAPNGAGPQPAKGSPFHFTPSSYTLSHGRHLSRLISHGYTTPNLTHPYELPCLFPADALDPLGREGHWHQSTPALRLRLCWRSNAMRNAQDKGAGEEETGKEGSSGKVCEGEEALEGEEVFFAVVHRKFSDGTLGMPLRYERFVVVWEGVWPWRVVGVGKGAVVFGEEVMRGFDEGSEDTLEEGGAKEAKGLKRDREFMHKVGFTYTTSIAWAWRPVRVEEESEDAEHLAGLGTGYLGDEIIMGIGLDDVAQMVLKIKVEELLSCLRLCPAVEKQRSGKK